MSFSHVAGLFIYEFLPCCVSGYIRAV